MCWIELHFVSFTIYVYKYLRDCLASWKDPVCRRGQKGAFGFSLSSKTSLVTLALLLCFSERCFLWQ